MSDDDAGFSDDYYDSDRYNTADGWEPPDPFKKLREKAREKDELIGPWNSMVEVCSADEILRGARTLLSASCRPPADLFGPLWREGELAVLAAETGVGKSILATQIAASIAKGERIEPFRSPDALRGRGGSLRGRGQPILYVDLQRSRAQFRERYTATSPNGKRRHSFGPNFKFVPIRDFGEPPPAFKRDLDKYLLRSIRWAIGETDARVIVIDNISYLASARGGPTRLMKTLKLWTMHSNLSILAIAHLRPTRASSRLSSPVSRLLSLCDVHNSIAQNADTIFAIARSTMSPDIRYLKHLKSNNLPATLDGPTVATFRIGRVESGQRTMDNTGAQAARAGSPPYAASRTGWGLPAPERGVDAALRGRRGGSLQNATENTEPTESGATGHADNFLTSANSPLSILNSQFPATPFLGFRFLGLSPEESHLIDYAAEALKRERAQETRLKKLRSGSVVDMILSPEYQRYLKGE